MKLRDRGCPLGLIWGVACPATDTESLGWSDDTTEEIGDPGEVDDGGPATRKAELLLVGCAVVGVTSLEKSNTI